MEQAEISQYINSLFESSCCDLLQSLDCKTTLSNKINHDLIDEPLACIDAGSDDIEFSVGLELPYSVLALTYPISDVLNISDEIIEDWISELSNQLMGRFKSKLYKHGIKVNLGLPLSYFSANLDDIIPREKNRHSVFVIVEGQVCGFHLGIDMLGNDIDFNEMETEYFVSNEGDIELF